MLVLTRKPSESICIGDDIVVTVVRIDRHQIRLGITAPSGIAIRRTELPPKPRVHVAPQQENRLEGAFALQGEWTP